MNTLLIIGAIVIIILFWIMNQNKINQAFSNVSVAEVKVLLEQEQVILLDVRRPHEIAQGKIGSAIELEVSNPGFSKKLQNLDKHKTYVVYCRSGHRSALACRLMARQGFTKIFNLKGGIMAWAA